MNHPLLGSLLLLGSLSFSAWGKEPEKEKEKKKSEPTMSPAVKTSFFGTHFIITQAQLTSGARNIEVGTTAQLQIGYGHLYKHGFWEVGPILFEGPFSQNADLPLPFTSMGYGAFASIGGTSPDQPLRSPHGAAVGWQLTLQYMDKTDRAIGSGPGNTPPYVGIISNHTTRIMDFSLYPGIFLAWMKKDPRPDIMDPESLKTRVEGYWLQFGYGLPLYTTFDERYFDSGIIPSGGGLPGSEKTRKTGRLQGYTLFASFTVVLGN